MTLHLFMATRGEWAKARFPGRAMSATVLRGADILIRATDGTHKVEKTYDVYAQFEGGESPVLNLAGVGLETARFNARCITGSFGEK